MAMNPDTSLLTKTPHPLFITFEGGEGSGKSTQLKRLSAHLSSLGIDHIVTREPGGSPVAERIRTLILSAGKDELDPLSEYLLFSAARRDHLRTVIEPALKAGKWVLSDRFYDSSVIYQGYAPQEKAPVPQAFLQTVFSEISRDTRQPDMTLIFDIDPEIGLARAKKVTADTDAQGGNDHFEAKALAFHKRVRQGFLEQSQRHPERCLVIDASGSLDDVSKSVLSTIVKKVQHSS